MIPNALILLETFPNDHFYATQAPVVPTTPSDARDRVNFPADRPSASEPPSGLIRGFIGNPGFLSSSRTVDPVPLVRVV